MIVSFDCGRIQRYFGGIALVSVEIGERNSVKRSFHASIISMLSGTAWFDFKSPPAATNSSAFIRAA
jgi:hypothetical protein